MMNRRNFLKKTALATAGLALTSFKDTDETIENKVDLKTVQKPIVLSTWRFGIEANAAAWEILSKNGRALDAVEAGVKIPSVISTAAGAHAFKNLAKFREAPALGDLAFMDFPHDGVDRISHVGIVVGISEGSITTIEGNTSGTGDQRNGGMVMIKTRALGTGSPVVGFGRCRFADFDEALPVVAEVITPKKKIGRLKK